MQSYEVLEREWARFNGVRQEQIVVCSSGTAALHLALEALHLPAGAEVIVPDFTQVACARAVALAGLTPVFISCNSSLLMSEMDLVGAVNKNIGAIMAVHIYGRQENMRIVHQETSTWRSVRAGLVPTQSASIPVIEDLAEAHGVAPHPDTDAACWSFYRNKIIAGEEGGAILFKNPGHTETARKLRSLGFDHQPSIVEGGVDFHDYTHIPRGHNYRLANCLADKILRSLEMYSYETYVDPSGQRWPSWIAARRGVENLYEERTKELWQSTGLVRVMPGRQAPWIYDLWIPDITLPDRNFLVRELNNRGYGVRCGFTPMHLQEEFKNCRVWGGESAERWGREIICLPINPGYTTKRVIDEMFALIRDFLL